MESLGEVFRGEAVLPEPAAGVRNSHPLVSARGGSRAGWRLVPGCLHILRSADAQVPYIK